MEWLYFTLFLALLGVGVGYMTYRLVTARCARVVRRFKQKFGDSLLLVTGCGVVVGYNRVPGVLALVEDRIFFEEAISGAGGSFALDDIEKIVFEKTWKSRYKRARKYRKAFALGFHLKYGNLALFVIAEKDHAAWQEALGVGEQSAIGGPGRG